MLVRSLLLVFICSSAMAQTQDRERLSHTPFRKQEVIKQNLEEARWRYGNLYLSPVIGFRQLGYDDNIFSTQTQQVEDFSLDPQVGLRSFYRPGTRWVWENSAAYDYLYYFEEDQLNGGQYNVESRLYGLFKRGYLDFGGRFNEDRQRLNSEIEDRVKSKRKTFNLNYAYQPSARSQIIFTTNFHDLEYDESQDPLRETDVDANGNGIADDNELFANLERDDVTYSVRYHQRTSNVLWPYLEADYQTFNFKSPDNPRDETTFTGLYVGLRTDNARRWILEGKIGVKSLDFQEVPAIINSGGDRGEPVDLDSNILVLEGFFNYKISRRYYVEGSVLNTPIFSLAREYTYFISRKVSMEFGWETRRKFRFGPEILVGSNDYEKTFDQTVTTLREDDLLGFNFNVTIPMRRLFEWRISAGYLERKSNIPGRSNEGFQLTSSVRYKRH